MSYGVGGLGRTLRMEFDVGVDQREEDEDKEEENRGEEREEREEREE